MVRLLNTLYLYFLASLCPCLSGRQVSGKMYCTKSDELFEDNRCIVPTESKPIAKGGINGALLCLVKGKVKAAINIGVVGKVIDGGWNYVFFYRHNAGNGLNGACGSQQMACH